MKSLNNRRPHGSAGGGLFSPRRGGTLLTVHFSVRQQRHTHPPPLPQGRHLLLAACRAPRAQLLRIVPRGTLPGAPCPAVCWAPAVNQVLSLQDMTGRGPPLRRLEAAPDDAILE
ncbi:MAG: hypothetical protein LBN98_02520 [Prevotellaceae bacterium]|nr:hypothetical protein [Prevotellaceae bacterium]